MAERPNMNEIPFLSQPIIPALNVSRKKKTMLVSGWKNKESQKLKKKKSTKRNTHEHHHGWADRTPGRWDGSCRLRIKHFRALSSSLFSTLFHQSSQENMVFLLPSSCTKYFERKKKTKSVQIRAFVKCSHFHLLSQITSDGMELHCHVFCQTCVSVVAVVCYSRSEAWACGDHSDAYMCVFVFFLSLLCDSVRPSHPLQWPFPGLAYAPQTEGDGKCEWQDSWLSEQLRKMVGREQK